MEKCAKRLVSLFRNVKTLPRHRGVQQNILKKSFASKVHHQSSHATKISTDFPTKYKALKTVFSKHKARNERKRLSGRNDHDGPARGR
jgi:hypothetical protein